MLDHEAVIAALPRLKVFPLPNGVLLPGSSLPLHVFEPRYLALVQEALAGDKVLAIAMLAPGWRARSSDRPLIRSIVGVGVIEEAQPQPDGHFDILVRGVMRARIKGEHAPEKPFREVTAIAVREIPLQDLRQVETVRRAVLQLSKTLPAKLAEALSIAAARIADPGTLCDVVAAALFEDPEALQAVLEAVDLEARVHCVLGEIGSLLLADRRPPRGLLC